MKIAYKLLGSRLCYIYHSLDWPFGSASYATYTFDGIDNFWNEQIITRCKLERVNLSDTDTLKRQASIVVNEPQTVNYFFL